MIYEPRQTERTSECPGPHPDRADLRCVYPDGHVVHWNGDREVWLAPTVADDIALAAARAEGWAAAVAALRDFERYSRWVTPGRWPAPSISAKVHFRNAAEYLEALAAAPDAQTTGGTADASHD